MGNTFQNNMAKLSNEEWHASATGIERDCSEAVSTGEIIENIDESHEMIRTLIKQAEYRIERLQNPS